MKFPNGISLELILVTELGRGGFGTVFKVSDSDKKSFALKVVDLYTETDTDQISAKKEIEVLRQLEHPNIVRICNACIERETWRSRCLILMELCEGGNLNDNLPKVQDNVKFILHQS